MLVHGFTLKRETYDRVENNALELTYYLDLVFANTSVGSMLIMQTKLTLIRGEKEM